MASVDTSQLLISTCQSLKVADVALDVRRQVQLFQHASLAYFCIYRWQVECDTSWYPITSRTTYTLRHLSPDRETHSTNKNQGMPTVWSKADFDWSESAKWLLESQLVPTLSALQRKIAWYVFNVGRFRNLKVHYQEISNF